MNIKYLLLIISFAAPVFSSLFCLILLIFRYRERDEYTKSGLLKLLMIYYMSLVCIGIAVLSFVLRKESFVYTSSLSYLSLLISVVVMYNIIFILTSTRQDEKIPTVNYIIPAVIFIVHLVWSLTVPFQVQYDIIDTFVIDKGNYFAFSILFSSKLWVWFAYTIIYTVLAIRRIVSYHKQVRNYSADEGRTSLRWLYIFIILTGVIIPPTFLYVFIDKNSIMQSLLPVIPNTLLLLQTIIFCYNMFTDNYFIMYPPGSIGEKDADKVANIDKDHFERFINEQKPYLDPDLKITDLTIHMCTNRSYLSTFINKTYGMNFSRYINNCRLRELQLLKADPVLSSYNESELVTRAGFSSMRGYRRFMKKVEQMNMKAKE